MLRLLSMSTFILLISAGLFGNQGDWDQNILPVAVWVVWWVGMAFVCALVGDVWALANPFAAIGRLVWRRPRVKLPGWVGVWPAVSLFLLFAWHGGEIARKT